MGSPCGGPHHKDYSLLWHKCGTLILGNVLLDYMLHLADSRRNFDGLRASHPEPGTLNLPVLRRE